LAIFVKQALITLFDIFFIILYKKKEGEKLKPVCPKCERKNVEYRIKTNEFVCKMCGYRAKKEEVIEA
jgi:tRNA(Ile2) C34 agmatinyltransferase TiaS